MRFQAAVSAALGALMLAGCAHMETPPMPESTALGGPPTTVPLAPAGGAAPTNTTAPTPEERARLAVHQKLRERLEIKRLPDDSLKLGVASDALFEFGSARATDTGRDTFTQIAELLRPCDRIVVYVVGLSDDGGTPDADLWLSKVRAASVAFVLEENGIPRERLRFEGRGNQEPLATGDSPAARKQNRRVDIVVRSLLPGHEQEAFKAPPYLGK